MKKGVAYICVLGVASAIIGAAYVYVGDPNAGVPLKFAEIVAQPTFLLVAGITVIAALGVAILLHFVMSNEVSGFRVGKKTTSGT